MVKSNAPPALTVAALVAKAVRVVSPVLKEKHAPKAVVSAALAGTVRLAMVTTLHRVPLQKSNSPQKQYLCKLLWLKTVLRVAVISR